MKTRMTITVITLVCVLTMAVPAFAQYDVENWHKPFAFLMGNTWQAKMPDGGSAGGNWEWMFEEKVIHAKGWTKDEAGKITGRNQTIMTWDPENKRPAFWFFMPDGSYSTGHMKMTKESEGNTYWDISGRHLLPDGNAYEWYGQWIIDPQKKIVTIHQMAPDGSGGWKIANTLNYHVVNP